MLLRFVKINNLHMFSALIFFSTVTTKVLNQGPLPRKRPRQKGFRAYRYRFLPFLCGEKKSRQNTDTAATKHRYSRNKTQYSRDKMLIDRDFHFFPIEMNKSHIFSTNMNINYKVLFLLTLS
jgi:hypothetical protein